MVTDVTCPLAPSQVRCQNIFGSDRSSRNSSFQYSLFIELTSWTSEFIKRTSNRLQVDLQWTSSRLQAKNLSVNAKLWYHTPYRPPFRSLKEEKHFFPSDDSNVSSVVEHKSKKDKCRVWLRQLNIMKYFLAKLYWGEIRKLLLNLLKIKASAPFW